MPQEDSDLRKQSSEHSDSRGPSRRQEWFFRSRTNGDTKAAGRNLLARASGQLRKLQKEQRLSALAHGKPLPQAPPGPPAPAPVHPVPLLGSVNWTPIGPSVMANGDVPGTPGVSGRFTSSAVGPGGSRVYAGSANGGVWFSGDSGATWAPLDDFSSSPDFTSGLEADSLSVGAMAVRFGATAATDTVFVGTGAPYDSAYFGVGIKFSASGGAPGTWTLEAATPLAGAFIYRIAIDPDNPSLVFAATSLGLYQRPTVGPSFTTWTNIVLPGPNQLNSDFIIAGSGVGKRYYAAFAAFGSAGVF